MAHDYRYNPYSDVIEAVSIANEIHKIPSNAPFFVRLRETPIKESPSQMHVRLNDNDFELTEVAASPAQGQYWPDYSTSDGWNTGLVQFSAADAGKLVKCSYKGIGTQASIKSERYPAWQLERGTGELGDKVCGNGEVFSGTYNFRSFVIPAGVSIFIDRTARMLCQGHFVNSGVINGAGRAISEIGFCAGRGGKGGDGGRGFTGPNLKGRPAAPAYQNYALGYDGGATPQLVASVMHCNQYDSICGSRGGTGGDNGGQNRPGGVGGMGGASIFVIAQTFVNYGTVTMAGAPGAGSGGYNDGGGGGGGGGGGAIVIVAAEVLASGNFACNGGAGGAPSGGAAWGATGYDGWIKILELGV